jgi:uncharacterized protein (TIGR02246 family)
MSHDPTVQHAIEATLIRYTWAIDAGDADGVANCFSKDGESVSPGGTKSGRDVIRADVEAMREQRASRGTVRHLVLNILVDELGADTAKVRSVFLATAASGGETSLFATGWYDDTFVKEDGDWLIKRRETHVDGR